MYKILNRKVVNINTIIFIFLFIDISILFFFNITYSTYDDYRISFIASGTLLSEETSPYMLYTNILFGKIISSLYNTFPAIPWYFIVLTLNLLLVHATFLYISKKHFNIFYAILLSSLFLLFLIQPTFTEVALLLCFAGIILFFHSINEKKVTYLNFIIIIYMLIFSSLIRFESFLLAFFIGMPLVLVYAYKYMNRKHILFITIILTIVFSLKYYSVYYYNHSSGWENFLEYNKYKSLLLDNQIDRISPNLNEALSGVNWSNNDYNMLKKWIFFQNDTYSLEKMAKLTSALNPNYLEKLTEVKEFYMTLFHNKYFIFFILISFLFLFTKNYSKKEILIITLALFLINAAFILITVLMKSPPPRLYKPLLFFFLIILYYTGKKKQYLYFKSVTTALSLVIALPIIYYTYLILKSNTLQEDQFIENLSLLDTDKCYISIKNAMNIRGINAKSNFLEYKDYKIIPFGTLMLSNDVKKLLAKCSNNSDLFLNLFKNKNYNIIVKNSDINYIDDIIMYIKEHYNKSVDIKIVRKNNFVTILQFID